MQQAWSSETIPRPFGLVSRPAPSRRTNSATSSPAPAVTAPPPAHTTGRRDSATSSATREMSPAVAVSSVRLPALLASGGVSGNGVEPYWKSIGISTDTGPRGGIIAWAAASARVEAMAAVERARYAAFEREANMASWSGTSWMNPRLCPRNLLSICPVTWRTGDDETHASSCPPIALAAPGPVEVRHTPRRPVVRE